MTSFPSPLLTFCSVNHFLRILYTYKGFFYAQTYLKCFSQPHKLLSHHSSVTSHQHMQGNRFSLMKFFLEKHIVSREPLCLCFCLDHIQRPASTGCYLLSEHKPQKDYLEWAALPFTTSASYPPQYHHKGWKFY